ncbi:NYN domain-containing protein [Pseudacidovorax sp. RU35E]|uniref:NYN domain-containing protein n=1 Tax=Pseudacidovorax sp. RU35E TaxID=1907403 RepID=UPI000953F9C4|nr:NYN domain-containing protein [Pseudacidovorax sp. RU35E]SIR44422.1 TIGR00288 family protein [Pseudacidovorax sp. RU35E]
MSTTAPLSGGKVMLLVDADNVSADVMEQAVRRVLVEHGHLHVRRAYCTPEVALRHQGLFKRLGMRPLVNLAAGKNSTDIALAVDALDLAIAERPQVVYLVSSDSDFAPLVLRLREKGCRVCGIGQQGKTGDETRAAYDHFIDLVHKGGDAPQAPVAGPSAAPARSPAARKVAAKKAPAARKTSRRAAAVPAAESAPAPAPAMQPLPAPALPPAPAAAPARKKASASPAAKKTRSAGTRGERVIEPAPPAEVQAVARKTASGRQDALVDADAILGAVPALRGGAEVALNDVAQALRAARVLGKNASSIKLFDKLPADFQVLHQPDRIRWKGAAGR